MTRDAFLEELASRLRSTRSARRRLEAEISDHLDDAVAAEIAAGLDLAEAEAAALARFGAASAIAARWNDDRVARRGARRRSAAALAIAAVAGVALGLTQYAAGRPAPHPPRPASGSPADHASQAPRRTHPVRPAP